MLCAENNTSKILTLPLKMNYNVKFNLKLSESEFTELKNEQNYERSASW